MITGKQDNFVVTGVIKDIPQNSHLHPDFMASLTTLPDSRNPTWISNNYYTYLLLRKGVNPVEFQKKLDEEFTQICQSAVESGGGHFP